MANLFEEDHFICSTYMQHRVSEVVKEIGTNEGVLSAVFGQQAKLKLFVEGG